MDKNDIIAASKDLNGGLRGILKPLALAHGKAKFEDIVQRVRIGRYNNRVYGLPAVSGKAMLEAIDFIESRDPSLFRDDIDEGYFVVNRFYCDMYPCLQGYIACRIEDVDYDHYLNTSFKDTNPSLFELDEFFQKHLSALEYKLIARYYGIDGTRDQYNKRLCESKRGFFKPMSEIFQDMESKPSPEQLEKMLEDILRFLRSRNALPVRTMLAIGNPVEEYAKKIEACDVHEKKMAVVDAERQLKNALHKEGLAIESEKDCILKLHRFTESKCNLAENAKDFLKRGFIEDRPLKDFVEKEPRITTILSTLEDEMRITTLRDLAREKYSKLREYLDEFDLILLQNVLLKAGYTGWEEDMTEVQYRREKRAQEDLNRAIARNEEEREEEYDDDYEYDEYSDSDFFDELEEEL